MKLLPYIVFALTSCAVSALAAEMAITQKDQTFSMASVNIGVGDKITFNNMDDVTHNISVRSADGDTEDLGLQKPGQKVVYKFPEAGTYRVICSIHPKMKMTVVVK